MWKAIGFFILLAIVGVICVSFGMLLGAIIGGIMIPIYIASIVAQALSNGGSIDDEI